MVICCNARVCEIYRSNYINILRAVKKVFNFNFNIQILDYVHSLSWLWKINCNVKLLKYSIFPISFFPFQILESQDSIIADETYNDTAILSEYKIPVGQPERRKMCCWLCIFSLYLSAPFSIVWHHVNDLSFFKNTNMFFQFINIYHGVS